uniref:Uncharacterized protein LOC104232915 n=1 Tax=Nicotiana sylvestris TaxID=4096 RepID=A0A1U7X0Z8_NICSY|nr:PREDICTED: uncharacterized protein LOC104232915 [Nicotiana sylvestris]
MSLSPAFFWLIGGFSKDSLLSLAEGFLKPSASSGCSGRRKIFLCHGEKICKKRMRSERKKKGFYQSVGKIEEPSWLMERVLYLGSNHFTDTIHSPFWGQKWERVGVKFPLFCPKKWGNPHFGDKVGVALRHGEKPDYRICPNLHIQYLLIAILALWKNNLNGSLSQEIDNLIKLQVPDLEKNMFIGEIPKEINNLVDLEELIVKACFK